MIETLKIDFGHWTDTKLADITSTNRISYEVEHEIR